MSISTRQRDILDWLQDAQALSTDALAERFRVSSQTIRRDINELDEQGLARRQHGGIALTPSQRNLSFAQRAHAQIERKRRIAAVAVAALPEGATVFLGYGTTVAEFARALPTDRALRVVTNNLDAALALAAKPAVETWLAGGRLRANDRDVMGAVTLDHLRRFRAQWAVIGVGAIAADGALCEFQPEEAELSRELIALSRRCLLLADGSKFRRDAPCHVAPLASVQRLYTDADAPAELQRLCAGCGVELHLC